MVDFRFGDRVRVVRVMDDAERVFLGVEGIVEIVGPSVSYLRFDECFEDAIGEYTAFPNCGYIVMENETLERID